MKKLVALSLILSLSMVNFVYADGKSSSGFIDVGSTHWAYKTINELTGKGIIKGYSDNTFKPSGNITTAEFLKIVASLDGKEIEKTGNHWASGYIDYAKKEGYFPDGMFQEESYDIPITREKMAVVMAIVADKKDSEAENAKITQENREKLETAVKDWSSICNDCKSNVSKAMLKGIIGGYPDSSFKPLNTATRAEASTMIVRLMNPSERIKKEYEPLNEKAEKINKNERFYFYYNQLTADEKAIYSLIDKNIRDFKSNIPFGKSIGKESLSKIVQAYERDNPEIYWIYDFEYYQTDDGKGITEIMLKVPSDAKSVLARISNEADYILEKKPKNSDFYDTVKYIYEAVINRVEYVSDAPNNQDIRSAILQKQAVCTGYAKMFEYLCIKAGIPATYVTGYIDDGKSRERHAWNLIQHGNDYAWIDTTWGDHPEVYTKEEAKYQYLHTYDYLYATDDILRSTHTVGTYVENIFAETEYKNLAKVWNFPNCTNENLYYYKKVGGYFDTYSKAGIEALFSKYVKEKNFSKMVFKFKNKKAYDAAYKDPYEFFDYLVSKYISQKGNKPVEYELWGSDESRVFTIKFKNKVNAK